MKKKWKNENNEKKEKKMKKKNSKKKQILQCTDAWVTRPERPKGVKDVIKQTWRAQSRSLEVGARRAPRLLVEHIYYITYVCYKHIDIQWKVFLIWGGEMESIFWTMDKNQSFSIRRLSFLGYFVCFWVSRQTGVLYSFFWWLRLTNFWSRTRSLHTFGKLSGKWEKRAFEPTFFLLHRFQTTTFTDWQLYWFVWRECERFDFSKKKNDWCLVELDGIQVKCKNWQSGLSILNQYFTSEGGEGGQEMEVRNLPGKTLLCSTPQAFFPRFCLLCPITVIWIWSLQVRWVCQGHHHYYSQVLELHLHRATLSSPFLRLHH